jgi:hypothetical protein
LEIICQKPSFPRFSPEDPRYFRRGTGGGLSRHGDAVKQTIWTHRDSGGTLVDAPFPAPVCAVTDFLDGKYAVQTLLLKSAKTSHDHFDELIR